MDKGQLVVNDLPPDACARLGMKLVVSEDNKHHSRGKVYDGSSFDFGFEDCGVWSSPWCADGPRCGTSDTSIVVLNHDDLPAVITCWVDWTDDSKCAALCKKKLD
ncbi:hypothetical protein AAVH_35550 [Aphelenchoides avenae]|nr:hypothetical protein AAVH_35550 [Aphelenchus avenae]